MMKKWIKIKRTRYDYDVKKDCKNMIKKDKETLRQKKVDVGDL